MTKRIVIALMFGSAIPVLSFYGLMPALSTVLIILIDFLLCCGIALLKPTAGLMKAATAIASCSLSLVVMDFALRPVVKQKLLGPPQLFMYYWPPMPTLWRYGTNLNYHDVVSGDLAGMSHPHYEQKRRFDFTTDAFGFRNYPWQVETKQKKQNGLILLGDSVGVGVGTTQEETWGTLLDRKYGFRTYNLSMAGSGPWHELMNLKIACQRLHCGSQTTVLWVMFAGNDLDDNYGDQLEPTLDNSLLQQLRVSSRTFRDMSPIRNLVERIRLLIHDPLAPQVLEREMPGGQKLLFRRRYIDATKLSYEGVRQHPHYPKLMAVMDEMKKYADAEHINVYLMVVPAKEEVYRWVLDGASAPSADTQPSGFERAVEERCRLEGFPFLDMKPLLVKEANRLFTQSGRLMWWADDTHWNEIGHEYAASVAHEFLSAPPQGIATAQTWTRPLAVKTN